ncbi:MULTISPECIES: excalibur calcium-binding domain-containing protein [unclassified Streptomyces]|uniref:excalibur calcium-binding domain-containing protein n=1 Tax=unclassified Streptomyces TaxID=2593676 RepID=UPI001F4F7E59|nr:MULTISPECIES: excalibur calcium-binding domain-containing protein [unclassified Streptomyces]
MNASSVVREYFAAINAQDYRRAWALGGKNLSASYVDFANGFVGTAHDNVHVLRVDGATVSVELEAEQSTGSVRVFEGTYRVQGSTIVAADMHEVTGPEPSPSGGSPYYANCAEARKAGVTPLHRGDPGYSPHLDRDGDGVACEPYPP